LENKIKKALVTGGAGFIGTHLVNRLILDGAQVSVIDNFSTGKRKNINPLANYWEQDISTINTEQLADYIKNTDVIFHMAARPSVQYSIDYPIESNQENVNGTLNVLVAAQKANVKKVIFSSTSAVYGEPETFPIQETDKINPMSPYALQKYIGEQYCRLFKNDIQTVCLRYFNVYGEGMNNEGAYRSVISVFTEQKKNNKPLTITNDGDQTRDFVYVEDVVRANILASTNTLIKSQGEAYNIGSGNNISVNKIADLFGGKKKYGEKRIEPKMCLSDISKAKENLGWEPRKDIQKWISELKLG